MHAGESEAPLVGEVSGDDVTDRALRDCSAMFGTCMCLDLSRRFLGAARPLVLKGSMLSDDDART